MANGSVEMVTAEVRGVLCVRAFRLRHIKHDIDPHLNNRSLPDSEPIMSTASTTTKACLIGAGIGSSAAAAFMIRVTLAVAVVSFAACATQAPAPPIWAEQKIENPRSRLDHEEIAAQYERQAVVDAAAAKRHQGYAAIYRKNVSPRSGAQEHLALAKHCENLARAYQQASDENTAVAKLHRQLAAETK